MICPLFSVILPLAGSQSPSDDDHSCNSLSQVSRSLFTPVQQAPSSLAAGYHRRSSTTFAHSRSPSRSPEFMMLPALHPPVIVTASDLDSEGECSDSPQKPWLPRPLFTEVYQDPVRTKEREEELNMLRKVQEEQAEIIGYIFERGNEEEESIALANGGHSSQGIPVSFNCYVRIVFAQALPSYPVFRFVLGNESKSCCIIWQLSVFATTNDKKAC